ncbi:MAG: CotH kinase family protein [Paludibacteraceae bacterium]|nr:CotH kinase family protein [Paludibacteraceae bacterium]
MKKRQLILQSLLLSCVTLTIFAAPPDGGPEQVCRHEFQIESSTVYCESEGYEIYKCRKCDSTYTQTVPPAGHNYNTEYLVSDCEQGGTVNHTCSRCGAKTTESFPAQAHNYQEKRIAATCEKDGTVEHTCTVCKKSYSETIAALGHNYETRVVSPSIYEDGYTLHQCTRCADSYKDSYVAKLDATDYFKPVRINEVMPCNTSTYVNTDNYNFSGYIEFRNSSSYDIDLSKCTLTHYKLTSKNNYKEKWVWMVDNSVVLTKNSLSILWLDESTLNNHAPYKLDSDGGYITLSYDGMLIDSIAYGYTDAHVSYGRYEDGEGYMHPSPFEENTFVVPNLGNTYRCQAPTINQNPGVLQSATDVTLSCATSGALIYYTLDGTEPSETNGILYNSAINVSENTNIRAVAVHSGMLSSKITTGSYIFNDDKHTRCSGFTLPIVSVTIDELYYDDPMLGMFVTGKNGIQGEKDCQRTKSNANQDWKRPLNFEYIVDGKQVVSQEVESEIVGGCSRLESIKSISLKASKKTGKNSFDYHFFKSKPDMIHRNLHLRNGGSGFSCVPFRDGLMQTFALGLNIDYQAYQPVAYYLNGKYIGMMALHERTSDDYVASNYGYEEDEIDMIRVSDQLGIKATKGDMTAYDELVDYLNHTDVNSDTYYKGAAARMDMDEYIDYQIVQQFVANIDWPGNNTKIWRVRDGGIFRWILFDTDYGFKLCMDWTGSSSRDMIQWCQGEGSTSWGNKKDWMVNIFKPLSKNKTFEKKFVTRFLQQLSTRFTEENINAVFDSITGLVEGEYCAYKNTSSVDAAKDMRKFALQRPEYIYKHINTYVKGDGIANLTIQSNVKDAVITLNDLAMSEYKGKYVIGYDLDINAYAPAGYQFSGWEISGEENIEIVKKSDAQPMFLPGYLSGKLKGETTIKALFTKESSSTPTLVINEICASSDKQSKNPDDYSDYPDWIEIYNYGTSPINLSGYQLINSKDQTTTTLPYRLDDMVLDAGGHMLLWAKGDSRLGLHYLDFKLNVDKPSEICLLSNDGYLIDCVRYESHETNESYGRDKDNGDSWTIFSYCADGKTLAASPKDENGMACSKSDVIDYESQYNLTIYPNPVTDFVYIQCNEKIQKCVCYNMNGMVMTESIQGNQIDVHNYLPGIYVLRIETEGSVYYQQFVKIR